MSMSDVRQACDSNLCIDFGGKWRLEADPFNYVLKRKQPKGYAVVGYYQDIEVVLNVILEKSLRDTEVKTLTGLKQTITHIRGEIKRYSAEITDSISKCQR